MSKRAPPPPPPPPPTPLHPQKMSTGPPAFPSSLAPNQGAPPPPKHPVSLAHPSPFPGGSHRPPCPPPPKPPAYIPPLPPVRRMKTTSTPIPSSPSFGSGKTLPQGSGSGWGSTLTADPAKKATLKPFYWVKLTHAIEGSIWAKEEQPETPDIDVSQLESLFSCSNWPDKITKRQGTSISEPEFVQLFFLELMKVPRVVSKLKVLLFKISFSSQVEDLSSSLHTINNASQAVKKSLKLRRILRIILKLGNVLNQGTSKGSAMGFKLDSVLKLPDISARNDKMTLMHYLCKHLAEKKPELLDFYEELPHLEAASKIQLKSVAEGMQAVSKGFEMVEQELAASASDGVIYVGFRKVLKSFLDSAEADVRSLTSLYDEAKRNADSLLRYFGEDPAICPLEQVTSTLVNFIDLFKKARDENACDAEA